MSEATLSILIPCYNEEEGIPYLVSQLNPVLQQLRRNYAVELVLVDDGSTDNTNKLLQQHYGSSQQIKIIKHERNKNLGAALKTGFAHCGGDFIAVLDSDCTWHPQLIIPMMNMMDQQTDIVTVSPYHPQGKVNNVPAYRIFLSKNASLLYRLLLNWNIHTYTAMVRVYKRAVIQNVTFEKDNFLGVTELLVKAILKGYTVKEFPAELNLRKFGSSKMSTFPVKVIQDHLSLMGMILKHKILRNSW